MLKSLKLCRILRVVLPYIIAILSYSQGRYKMPNIIEIILFIFIMCLLAYNLRLSVEEYLLEDEEE